MVSKMAIVIDVARELFAEKGYDNTSMADICNKASVSKGLIYHHFSSKEELLKAIYISTVEEMKNLGGEINLNKPPKEIIIEYIDTIIEQVKLHKTFFKIHLNNSVFQPSTRKILQEHIASTTTTYLEQVKMVFNRVDKKNADVLSYLLISKIDGVVLNYLTVFKDYPIDQVKKALIEEYKILLNQNLS